MHWAKPDTSQDTFMQRWANISTHDTFKQRWPKISGEPRRGKKDREAARLAQGLNRLDWH
jgi:hypothetical protein